MKAGLIEKIQQRAYWRVNIRPTSIADPRLTLERCRTAVADSAVRLRGWDAPHISTRNDASGGFALVGEYVENWCDWNAHIEFWRMYRSSQFLHYRALWEDYTNLPNKPDGPLLSVTSAIWSVAEYVELVFRFHANGLLQQGCELHISLENSQGRTLWVTEFNRAPFSYDRATDAPQICLHRPFAEASFLEEPQEHALEIALDLFDNFGWYPSREQIAADIHKLYRRDL